MFDWCASTPIRTLPLSLTALAAAHRQAERMPRPARTLRIASPAGGQPHRPTDPVFAGAGLTDTIQHQPHLTPP